MNCRLFGLSEPFEFLPGRKRKQLIVSAAGKPRITAVDEDHWVAGVPEAARLLLCHGDAAVFGHLPVSVLEVHGTSDLVIAYDGGTNVGQDYPGARETVRGWASLNGCGTTVQTAGAPIDIDTNIAGNETVRTQYVCSTGAAELWTIVNGSHIPGIDAKWGNEVWNFLSAHPKP